MIRQRVTAVVVKERKLLLVKDGESEQFYTPGGKIEDGETHSEALAREMKEEVSAEVISHSPFCQYRLINSVLNVEQDEHVYLVDIAGDVAMDNEITHLGWYSKEEMETMNLCKDTRDEIVARLTEQNLL